jgi:hypothetical protein
MNTPSLHRITLAIFIVILFTIPVNITADSQKTPKLTTGPQAIITGDILYSPINSATTYLIDRNGTLKHSWSSDYLPGESVLWIGDGTIMRAIKTDVVGYGGSGGGVQQVQWDGTLIWDYRYNTDGNLSHHDIELLPNGHVLLIAWEQKTRDEAIAAGRNPDTIQGTIFLPLKVIEVQPTGPTTGTIVWQWRVWDHLIQDYDPVKNNYGIVGHHPELIDINYGDQSIGMSDWLHTNSIDYNPDLDQILLSAHNFNEVWIIDHNTTTEEAAGHTGGHNGKGGDLLYRWGNPNAFRAGPLSDKKLFGQHDANWIPPTYPGAGDILVFNNGYNRPEGDYSTVDEITPPVDDNGNYYLENGHPYGPDEQTWIYIANPPTDFYSAQFSSAERLSDGNTLICSGGPGIFFEVTPEKNILWSYANPYPLPAINQVFKIEYVSSNEPPEPSVPNLYCTGSLSWSGIEPGATVTGSFQVQNIGDTGSLLNWTINTSSITWGTWTYSPDSGDNLTPEQGPTTIQVTVTAPNEADSSFEGYIQVINCNDPSDTEVVPVTLTTPTDLTINQQTIPTQQTIHQLPTPPTRLSLITRFLHTRSFLLQ